ncbi:MAG TPA: exopolysaccharide biosynthesis polyprenyl glycosylphosphotransferase [Caulobacterales bacterium]|nr:exopolysaccharide biosynthesis polyprenyl glycosylphosphotransferase [Caulobacterales bacterium]
MSQAAWRIRRAKTEQEAQSPAGEASAHETNLRRLAELQAAFEMFGTPEITEISAETAYRSAPEAPTKPANDPAPRMAFPDLKRRGPRLDPALAGALLKGLDWTVILLVADLAARWSAGLDLISLTIGQACAFIAAAGALKLGLWLTGTYSAAPQKLTPEHGVGGLALGALIGLAIATAFAPDARAAAALSAVLPLGAILLAGVHAAFAVWLSAAHKAGAFAENIVLIGATDAAERLVARAAETGEARVVAVVDDRLARAPLQVRGAPVPGSLEDLLNWRSLPEVDRIVITVTQKAEGRVRALIEKLRVVPNRVDLLMDYEADSVRGAKLASIGRTPVACVSGRPHAGARALIKRVEDLVLGGALLAAFAPFMLAIAIAVKLDSNGPVIYRQRRHGFNNRVITVFKFRTMRHEPDASLRQVQPNDPRITRIGRLLRRTSLDELPQLVNVLLGDMSLVGPRPHAVGMKAAERDLEHIVAEYAHRHRVKPGITGWAQINGSRGPIETPAAVRERVRLDLDYVSRASFLLDLWILARTAPALLGDAKATR